MRDQPVTGTCIAGPVHCSMMVAIDWFSPEAKQMTQTILRAFLPGARSVEVVARDDGRHLGDRKSVV